MKRILKFLLNPIGHRRFGILELLIVLLPRLLQKNLELNPINKVLVEHAKGASYENVYLAILQVTPKYYMEVELTECQSISNNFEIIIGMDVIRQGDFALTSKKGIITFSFRLPSSTTIDFTSESYQV